MARIVDKIRAFLLSYDQSNSPELGELAREYVDACSAINKRLASCQRLLQQDLRVEALHLAREAPDVLEDIKTAEFPERPAWMEVVELYNLSSPPEFNAVAIEFLESAYRDDIPLQELLRTHRRLALMRAPLRQRIDLLRQLSAKDRNSRIWSMDIESFEVARIEQIKQEAHDAKRREDEVALGQLHDELTSKNWLVPPPKGLIRGVGQALVALRRVMLLRSISDLVVQAEEAMAVKDDDAALRIEGRWWELDARLRELEGIDGQASENPYRNQLESFFAWVEVIKVGFVEADYNDAVARLEYGLANQATPDELKELRDYVLAFERGIPQDVEDRYQALLARLNKKPGWWSINRR